MPIRHLRYARILTLLAFAALTFLTCDLARHASAQTPVTNAKSAAPDILATPAPAGSQQRSPASPNGAAPQPSSPQLPAMQGTPSQDGTPDRTRIAFIEDVKVDQPATAAPQKVKGRFADIVRVTDPKLRDQVVIEGSVRYEAVPGEQGKRAVISWNQVGRSDQAEKKKPLTAPLQSAFKPLESTVGAGNAVNAQGDVAAAIAAAQALFEEEKKEEAKASTNTQQPQQQQQQKSPSGLSSDQAKNDMFRNITVPDNGGITVNPETGDVTATTTEGCAVRVDLAQGVAIQQSRITTNGTPTGECTDTETRYQLQKSYIGCEDLVKKDEGKAFAQFRNYYMRSDGTTSYLGDACQQDPETAFALTEEASSCTTETNITELKAYRRSELVYVNKQAQRVVVEGCRRTPNTDPIAMNYSVEGCAIRHDFPGGNSVQQKKVVYNDAQGAMFQVSGCADSEEASDRFAHAKDYSVCQPILNMNAMQAVPQFRIFIQPPAGKTFISECAPDQDAAVVVQESTEGCETVFFHDLPAGQSFGASRFRYQGTDGTIKFVNDSCQKSTATFTHQLETQGYEHHDDQKFSYAKQAVYINTSGGRVDVSPALVRSGTAQLPYTLIGTSNVPKIADVTYQGCNKYVPTDATENYKRADNTLYNYVSGVGPVSGPTDVCVTTLIDNRRLTTGYYYQLFHEVGESNSQSYWYQRMWVNGLVQKHQLKNAETGEIVGNTCKFDSGGWYSGNGAIMDDQHLNWHWTNIGAPGPPVQQMFLPGPCPY